MKQLGTQIATFAHSRPSIAGVGSGVRCAVRVPGQADHKAYVEALRASTSEAWSARDLG